MRWIGKPVAARNALPDSIVCGNLRRRRFGYAAHPVDPLVLTLREEETKRA
jgi:hypothetical protein